MDEACHTLYPKKGDEVSMKISRPTITGTLSVLAVLIVLPYDVSAQAPAGAAPAGQPAAAAQPSASELAKQTQNPIASLVSVPFESNSDFGIGDRKATGAVLNFQPVVPFAITPSTNVVLRVIMPLSTQPAPDGKTRYSGMGDVLTTAFFSPSKAGRLIWGAGPALRLPTATNQALGSEKFGLGPSVVVLTQPGKWTFGLLANQIWSVSGAIDRPAINAMYLQPFTHYNLGSGLSVGASMEASASWKAKEVWSAPLLFNVSKVAMLGKRPIKLLAGAGPYVAGPQGAPSWRFRLAATFLFPR